MVQVVHVVPVRGRGLYGPRVLSEKGVAPLTHLSGLPRISLHFAGIDQVWSVTQFHSIGFLQSRIMVYCKSVFSKTHNRGLCQLLLTARELLDENNILADDG